MSPLVIYAQLAMLVVCAAAVAISLSRTHRRRHHRPDPPPPGFVPTDERSVDPVTGATEVVWYNPQTGERRYQARTPDAGA